MFRKSNKTAKWLAIIAGMLLLLAGITGASYIITLGNFIVDYISGNYVVIIILNILLLIASLGGIAVIIGGMLIGKGRIWLGKMLIQLGSGAGILSLLFHLALAIYTKSLSMASFLSIGTIGIMLSVIAPFYAKR